MKGKRGILLKETLYLVLAIMFLAVVSAGAYEVYKNFTTDQNKLQAQGLLERLSFFLKDIKEGDTAPFLFYAPKGYYFVYLANSPVVSDASCGGRDAKCMCICKKKDCSGEEAYCKQIALPISVEGAKVSIVTTFKNEESRTVQSVQKVKEIQIDLTELSVQRTKTSYDVKEVKNILDQSLTSKAAVNPDLPVQHPPLISAQNRKPGTIVDLIILHHTAGTTWTGAYDTFRAAPQNASAHYIIDRDGTIYYIVDESKRALHAGDVNEYSIGIEIVSMGSNGYTSKQYDALNALLKDIESRYPAITHDKEHILAHYETDQGRADNKPDPACFDWERISLTTPLMRPSFNCACEDCVP